MMRIELKELISIVLESAEQRNRAEKTLDSANLKDYFDSLLELVRHSDGNTEKHLPKLAKFVVEKSKDHGRVSTDVIISNVGIYYKRYLNSELKKNDIFKYKNFEEFKKDVDSVRTSDNSLTEAEKQPVHKDDDFEVYKGTTPWSCMHHGKGYSWCISRKTGNLFYSYRLNHGYIFYFIKNLNKSSKKDDDGNFEDTHHAIVLGVNTNPNKPYNITMADNGSQDGGTKAGLSDVGVLDLAPELAPLLAEEIFKPKPLTPEEKTTITKISERIYSLEEFKELNFDLKEKYILMGHPIGIMQWSYLPAELKEVYINAGNHDIPEGARISSKLMKRYQSTLKNRIDIKIADWETLQLSPTKDESGFFNKHIGIWIPKRADDAGKFDESTINTIITLLGTKVDPDKIALIANPEFDKRRMDALELFQRNLSYDIIKKLASPEYNYRQITCIGNAYNNGMDPEKIKLFLDPKFDPSKMHLILSGFERGLSVQQAEVFADPEMDNEKMRDLRDALLFGLSIEEVKPLADPKYDVFAVDRALKEISGYGESARMVIMDARKHLDEEEMEILMNPEFTSRQMEEIYRGLISPMIDYDATPLFANPALTGDQIMRIVNALDSKCSIENVRRYAKPEFSPEQMKVITLMILAYERSHSNNVEILDAMIDPANSINTMNVIRSAYDSGNGLGFVRLIKGRSLSDTQLRAVITGLKGSNPLTDEYIGLYLDHPFDDDQVEMILRGCYLGFSVEQVAMYAKPEFDYNQMMEIGKGLRAGLSLEQVALYAKPEFDYEQMAELSNALKNNVDMTTVLQYANPTNTPAEMRLGMMGH